MKVKKALILAAGKGTRFLPYTKAYPKEMLAVIDKPALQLIVEEVVQADITDVAVVISPEKQKIVEHFTPMPQRLHQCHHRAAINASGKESPYRHIRYHLPGYSFF